MIGTINLDECKAFSRLVAKRTLPKPDLVTADAIEERSIETGSDLEFNWASAGLGDDIISVLQELADEQQLIEQYESLYSGEIMNTGEKRMVLHHLLRGQLGAAVVREGKDYRHFFETEQKRFGDFAEAVHEGTIAGKNGQKFDTVVQIGIGGSDLGPRALYLALERWARTEGQFFMSARFISNVDPDDGLLVLNSVNLSTTLFVLVSKSGVTQETLANETLVRHYLKEAGLDPACHIVAVTSESSPLAHNPQYLDSFYIDDSIGGRYSSTSAVGGVILSLAFGRDCFAEILDGAHESDQHARVPRIIDNAALLDAMIGIYYRNVLGWPVTAVLPYTDGLLRFPAHLQQLDMESNGKRVNRQGKPLGYSTGPVVFGEPGTNGQHSFYQLLHQGTDIVPLQFIGFITGQDFSDIKVDGSSSRDKLNANLAAQIVAFMRGSESDVPAKVFPGGRPSTLMHGERLDPRSLGALLAHFENKVMFQGFAWNINSFDQEGVQLGKRLANKVLAGAGNDEVLRAYSRMMGVLT